jgi:hypothetical protein
VDLSERKDAGARRHPWEVARAGFFLALLEEHRLLRGHAWLDVGAGDAWFAARLRPCLPAEASLTCWDPNYTPDDLAAEHAGLTLTRDRPDRRFDRILMLDVIEHVEDDVAYVTGIVDTLLAETGWVLVSVPAYPSLFSSHDRALRHHRRYSPEACHALLEEAGLSIISEGGLFGSLLLPRAARVGIERVGLDRRASHGVGAWHAGTALTNAFTQVLVFDGKLSLAASRRGRPLPGLSYWAVASQAA